MFFRARFQTVPHPVANAGVLNVHEFGADRARVNFLEQRNHLAQRHLLVVEEKFGSDLEIEVFFAETELAQSEQRILGSLLRQGIYSRDRVTKRAISVNECVDARLQGAFATLDARRSVGPRAIFLRQITKLKSLEECRPTRIDRCRVPLPTLVILLD